MKLLWLCNIELPLISEYLGKRTEVFGGWLDSTARDFLQNEDNQLMVMYPCNERVQGNEKNLCYKGFTPAESGTFFDVVIREFQPDVIHVWGTEFSHTKKIVETARRINFKNIVISIQGLVSIYAQHYCTGLPNKLLFHKTIRELIKGDNLERSQKEYEKRGKDEIYAIDNVKNIIGRTDFDYACVKLFNKDVRYFHCNETLREVFYEGCWKIENTKPHTIFISQCNYPIKGFHFVLRALQYIKKVYPDVHIYTTGFDYVKKGSDIFRRTTYQKYIRQLIIENDLENNITFLGMLNAEEMKEQYLSANVVLSPSTIENSSNAIGEAMLLGCPVVASDVGGIKSLLQHEEEGLIYQSDADYMLAYSVMRIFGDSELATRLGNNAKCRAQVTHNRTVNYERLIDIYKMLISEDN